MWENTPERASAVLLFPFDLRKNNTSSRQDIASRYKRPYKRSGIIKNPAVFDRKMWPLAVLTGFFYETMYCRFSGPNKCSRYNEVAVLTKWS